MDTHRVRLGGKNHNEMLAVCAAVNTRRNSETALFYSSVIFGITHHFVWKSRFAEDYGQGENYLKGSTSYSQFYSTKLNRTSSVRVL